MPPQYTIANTAALYIPTVSGMHSHALQRSQESAIVTTPATHVPLLDELRSLFDDHVPNGDGLSSPPSPDAAHILFFDGGSRGNPGPGGSGACVVRVDARTGASTLVWRRP
jgi:hypothetical protein